MAQQLVNTFEPAYYEKFACTSSGCKYTCCRDWLITMNKSEYSELRNLRVSSELRGLLTKYVKRAKGNTLGDGYAIMHLDERGMCPFLSPEGLCRMQVECGYSVLTTVCKQFPRMSTTVGTYIQRCCSTGCEATLELLLAEKNGLRFVERTVPTYRYCEAIAPHTEGPLATAEPFLSQIQALCIAILQDKRYTLPERMILLGISLGDLDEALAAGTVPDWLRRRTSLVTSDDTSAIQASLAQLPPNSNAAALNALLMANIYQNITQNKTNCALLTEALSALGATSSITATLARGEASPPTNSVTSQLTISHNNVKYNEAKQLRTKVTSEFDYLFENVIVNFFFGRCYPLRGAATAWDTYLEFCCTYNFMDVITAGYTAAHPTRDGYLYALTVCSRMLYHAAEFRETLVTQLHTTSADTLAHMAILVKG